MLITETFYTEAKDLQFEPGLIKNVRICGPTSKNGRDYSWPALKNGRGLYEGAMVFVNHSLKPGDPRKAEDRFGDLINIRHVPGDGNRGDLRYLESHSMAEVVKEDLRRNLGFFGLSHEIDGKVSRTPGKSRVTVESIDKVFCVSLVTNPATTRSLMENTNPNGAETSTVDAAVDEAFATAAMAVLVDKALTKDEKLKKIGEILDSHEELTKKSEEGVEKKEEPKTEQTTLAEQLKALTEQVAALTAQSTKPAPKYVKPQSTPAQIAEQTGSAIPKDPKELAKWLQRRD